MKKVIFLSLLFIGFFSSCKKDSVPEESLKGKWTLQNIIIKEYDNNVLIDTQTNPGDGTSLDFQNNGNVVITTTSGVETYPYTISGSNVSFEGETYQIRDLRASSVTLYLRDDLGSVGDYYEFFANLTR